MLHAIVLGLAFSAPQSGHAGLHPAGAEVFAEIPDVRAVRAAYAKAPLVRILDDEDVRDSIATLSGREEFDPWAELHAKLAEELPLEALEPFWDGLRAASVSVVLPEGEDAGPEDGSYALILELGSPELAEEVCAFVAERAGSAPVEGVSLPGLRRLAPEDATASEIGLWCAPVWTRAVFGAGRYTPERHGALAIGGEPSLASDERYRASGAGLEPATGVTVFDVYFGLSFARLAELGAFDTMPASVLPAWLTSMQGQRWRARFDAGGFVEESYAQLPPESPYDAMEPIGPRALAVLPARTLVGGGAGLDLAAAVRSVAELFQSMHAPDLGPVQPLLAPLGPGIATWVGRARGLTLPEVGLWLELRDREAFERALDPLLDRLAEEVSEEGGALRRSDEEGTRFVTLELPPEVRADLPFPLSPTLFVRAGECVLGLTEEDARATAERLASGSTGGRHPLAAAALPEGALAVYRFEWDALVADALDTLRQLGAMLPFDAEALPPTDAITRHLFPSVSVATWKDGGIHTRVRSPFGPEGNYAIVGLFLLPGLVFADFAPAPDLPHDRTHILLVTIASELAAHCAEGGALPASIEEIVRPIEEGGLGLFGGRVPLDGWGRPLRYERAPDGESYRLWSLGPDGEDQGGGGDDVSL